MGGRGLLLYTAILTDGRVFFGAVGLGREAGSTFRTVLRACVRVWELELIVTTTTCCTVQGKAEAAKCFNGLIAS